MKSLASRLAFAVDRTPGRCGWVPWLLTDGWRIHGPIALAEVPGART